MAIDKQFADRFARASVEEVLDFFPGDLVERVIYHSSAYGGYSLIASILKDVGFRGELEWPTDSFCGQQIFVAKN